MLPNPTPSELPEALQMLVGDRSLPEPRGSYSSTSPHSLSLSLSDHSPHPVEYGRKVYPTSEHLFQALKVGASLCLRRCISFIVPPPPSSWRAGLCFLSTSGPVAGRRGLQKLRPPDLNLKSDQTGRMSRSLSCVHLSL